MSLRYDRDNFWFVLLHEIEHVLNRDGYGSPDWSPPQPRYRSATVAKGNSIHAFSEAPRESQAHHLSNCLDGWVGKCAGHCEFRWSVTWLILLNSCRGLSIPQLGEIVARQQFSNCRVGGNPRPFRAIAGHRRQPVRRNVGPRYARGVYH
jgi:hypothetical protein